MVICLEWGGQTCIWPSWCRFHSLSLASVESRLVLFLWYRLTWVFPEKGPLNVCVCVCVCVHVITVLCRYYEDFKITSGTSNLTKIYVEASIACNICPCFLTILCICSQQVLSVSLIGFVFKISLQLFLHFIHLCLYVPSFNVTMFLWSLWCYVIQVWL